MFLPDAKPNSFSHAKGGGGGGGAHKVSTWELEVLAIQQDIVLRMQNVDPVLGGVVINDRSLRSIYI